MRMPKVTIVTFLLTLLAAILLFAFLEHPAHSQSNNPYASPYFGYSNPIFCNNYAYYDASTNGATKLVAGLSNKLTYICGFNFYAGGTGNVSLQEGTGTNCGTGTVTLTPAFQLKTQDGVVDPSPSWRGLRTQIQGDDLCINSSAGVAIQGIVYYVQF